VLQLRDLCDEVAIERTALEATPRLTDKRKRTHDSKHKSSSRPANYGTRQIDAEHPDDHINVLFSCRREQFVRLLCDWAEYGLATYGKQLPVTQLHGR
jgi:hypothetical protein